MMRLLVFFAAVTSSSLLLGTKVHDYKANEKVELTVNALSSLHKSLIPWDYYNPRLHFCKPVTPVAYGESLGGVLYGDRLFSSSFEVSRIFNISCT